MINRLEEILSHGHRLSNRYHGNTSVDRGAPDCYISAAMGLASVAARAPRGCTSHPLTRG